MAGPEARERDRWLGEVGALQGFYVTRCEPMSNQWHVQALPDGFPDVLCVGNGIIALVEWKSATGRKRESQVKFHAALAKAGYRVLIARDAGQCCRDLAAIFGGEIAATLIKCAESLDAKKIAAG